MKKLLVILAVAALGSSVCYADTGQANTDVSVTVNPIFSVEFYTDENVLSSTSLSFPTIDSTNIETAMILPTGRTVNDGKSDVGILCRSNKNVAWALQINMHTASPGFTTDNLAIYVPGAAYFRNTDPATQLGGMQFAAGWYSIWDAPRNVYVADANHVVNTPFGTLVTFSFAILPQGQAKIDFGTPSEYTIGGGNPLLLGTHTAKIKYTMTTSF